MGGPWLPAESARALAWWDETALARAASALDAVTAEWRAAWAMQEPAAASRCSAFKPQRAPLEHWAAFISASGENAAWLLQDEQANREVGTALFGDAASGAPMAETVRQACIADWKGRLARCLGLQVAATPAPDPTRPGSGAIEAELPGLRLVISSEVARRWQGRSTPVKRAAAAPLTPVDQALATRTLTFGVELDGCDLSFGSVQDLQVGDVVRIDHALEAPAWLTDASGATAFSGYLGRQGARKAVELVSSAGVVS